MKNRAGLGVALIILASLTCFAPTGFGQATPGKVEINNDNIVIHPGVKLTKPDAAQLDAVLSQYDKSLYKIEVYNKGKTSSTSGSLLDMCVDQRTVAELTQAKSQGQSERAIQLIAPGSSVNPTNSTSGSPTPPGTVPVNPTMSPVNPTKNGMSPVNPTKIDGAMPSGPQMPTTPAPSGPQAPTPSGPQAAVNPTTGVNPPQVSVNPNNSTNCAPTDPKAAEFLAKVKPILQKYSR